jgi:hypothetical protein
MEHASGDDILYFWEVCAPLVDTSNVFCRNVGNGSPGLNGNNTGGDSTKLKTSFK